MNNRARGEDYEIRAAKYLEDSGHKILARNFRDKFGEIDIVSFDTKGKCIVFTEVKYRKRVGQGMALEAVTASKQKRISMTADSFIMRNKGYADISARFDVVAFDGENMEHVKDAFSYVGRRYM
ncbi:MAG: YraN family protein [Lachnospiraceae bacterium]|nr:YraN family protein [Lachnospiraceae bacterium]